VVWGGVTKLTLLVIPVKGLTLTRLLLNVKLHFDMKGCGLLRSPLNESLPHCQGFDKAAAGVTAAGLGLES
jgi:hypothetical protein